VSHAPSGRHRHRHPPAHPGSRRTRSREHDDPRRLRRGAQLQAAIDAASPGDTLLIDGTCLANVSVQKDLTFQGQGPHPTIRGSAVTAAEVILIGSFDVSPLNVTIRDLTITGGMGHGIRWFEYTAGTLTIDRATIRGNVKTGLICHGFGTTVTISRSEVTANGQGGIVSDVTMTLDKTKVRDNTGGSGVANLSTLVGHGVMTIVDSDVSGNTSPHRGGGIYNGRNYVAEPTWAFLTITRSKVLDNAASDGGGIYNDADPSAVTLFKARIMHNTPNDCVGVTC
jgi:hypothetical protein